MRYPACDGCCNQGRRTCNCSRFVDITPKEVAIYAIIICLIIIVGSCAHA